MDLWQYARVLRAHWLIIVLSVLTCTGVAACVALTSPPTYAAETQLYVSSSTSDTDPSSADSYAAILLSQQRAVSYTPLVTSPNVVLGVNKRLGLSLSLEQFRTKVSAERPEGTALINVTASAQSPQSAKAIADAVAEVFPSFVKGLEAANGAQNPVTVVVASPAELPSRPVAPRKALSLILGALVGLVLGIVAAVIREALSRRIRSSEDVTATTGLPVLGSIGAQTRARREPLVVLNDPLSAHAEEYRRVRTNLRALIGDRKGRSFVVSSATANEGKTLVTANLGIAFAQAGHRVLLVDANLRQPGLAELMGMTSAVGLTDVLSGEVPVGHTLRAWRNDLPLDVLGGGVQAQNASELLSQRFAEVLQELTERADIVIVDTPAVLPTTDAAVIARLTAGAVLVARAGSTRAHQFARAVSSLYTAESLVLGVILNRVGLRGAGRHYGAEYGPQPDARPESESGHSIGLGVGGPIGLERKLDDVALQDKEAAEGLWERRPR